MQACLQERTNEKAGFREAEGRRLLASPSEITDGNLLKNQSAAQLTPFPYKADIATKCGNTANIF
jgi:hypothetical protein